MSCNSRRRRCRCLCRRRCRRLCRRLHHDGREKTLRQNSTRLGQIEPDANESVAQNRRRLKFFSKKIIRNFCK